VAASGIRNGIVPAPARATGTAPLQTPVGYSQAINSDMFSGFTGWLPGMMCHQTSAPAGADPIPADGCGGAALSLILLIAVTDVGASVAARFFALKKVWRVIAGAAKPGEAGRHQ
jgi:phosphate transport system permease protein